MADSDIQLSASLDPASEAQIANQIGQAGTKGGQRMSSELDQAVRGVVGQISKLFTETFSGSTFKGATQGANGFGSSIEAVSKQVLQLTAEMKKLGAGTTAIAEGINQQSTVIRRASVEATNAAQQSATERVAILRREGSLASIEAQRSSNIQIIAARTAGQQRVAITRGVVDTLVRLERQLGEGIAGAARTTVSALSRISSGVAGAFSKLAGRDKEVFNNTTLKSSLSERERVINSSFSRQEREVRESLHRTERQVNSFRDQTQKGLIGLANQRNLFAGLFATIGIGAIARSTFTVGSEFVRGLAVLQSSLSLTDQQMKGVRATSIALGNDISLPGVSALDAAQAIQTLTKQFGSLGPAAVDAAQAAAKGTLQLSRASGATAEDAAALIGASVNVFGVAADDAVAAADKIAGALVRAAGVGFEDFKDSFVQGATVFEQFVGPAESANDTLLDFNTTLAILAKNGITGSQAGAGLKQFFLQATQNSKSAEKATNQVVKAAGTTGKIFFDANGNARKFADAVDILRRGTKGLNDEQRNLLLGDLFGSRSITVANALINSTGESFGELRKQIAEQGLAAKIAAAQNTGLKGALDALQSVAETVQIVLFETIQKPLGNAVVAVAEFANKILFGAGPALKALRQGLLGAGAGIAILLSLKGAVEIISLLGKAIALSVTPFGLLAVAAAGIGAVLGIMSSKGLSLTEVFDNIRSKAVDLGRQGLDFILPKLEALRELFVGTIIPAAIRVAEVVGGALVDAFHATAGFVQSTVVPALRLFADFVTGTVVPAVVAGATAIANFATGVALGIAHLAQTVFPVLKPMVDGFISVGKALGSALGGDFSNFGAGFASLGSGIAATATRIASNVATALAPVAKTVGNFFKNLFTIDNLNTAIDAVGQALQFVARQIATVLSEPKFLAGVGIAVGALIDIGVRWAKAIITGLLQGFGSNAGQLFHDLMAIVGKGLSAAFSSPTALAGVVAVTALVATLGPSLFRAFSLAGEQGASGLASGFASKLKALPSSVSAFFGGPDRAISGTNPFSAMTKEAQTLQNQLRALGSESVINVSNIDQGRKELELLRSGLTQTQIAALEARDRFSSLGLAFTAFKSGAKEVFGGIGNIFTGTGTAIFSGSDAGINAGFARIKAGLSTAFKGLQTFAEEQGTTVGKLVAGGIVKGLAGLAAAGGAGVTFGQQIGQGNTLLGLLGLGTSAIGIGTALGGPLGLAAGVATLAIGGITAAMTSSSEAAKKYKADVDKIAASLSPGLADAAKQGKVSLDDLRSGLTFGDLSGTSLFGDAFKSILDSLSGTSTATLAGTDFGQQFSTGFASAVQSGAGLDQIQQQLLDITFASGSFGKTFGDNAGIVQKAIKDIVKPGGVATFNELLGDLQTRANKSFTPQDTARLAKYADQIEPIISLYNDLSQAYSKNADALKQAGDKQALFATATSSVHDPLDVQLQNLKAIQAELDKFKDFGATPAVQITGKDDGVLLAANDQLQAIIDKKNAINNLFSTGVLPPGLTPFQDTLQQAAIATADIGKSIQEITANGGFDFLTGAKIDQQLKGFSDNITKAFKAGFDSGDIIDEATARSKLQPIFDAAAAGADDATKARLQAAFDNVILNLVPTIDQTAALNAAQLALGVAQGFVDGSPIAVGITPPEIPMDGAIADAQATATANPVSVPVTLDTSAISGGGGTKRQSLIGGSGNSGGLGLGTIAIPAVIQLPKLADGWGDSAQSQINRSMPKIPPLIMPPIVIPGGWFGSAAGAAFVAGQQIGSNLGRGVVVGIQGQIGAAARAAAQLAAIAAAAARAAAGISSPSKVFRQIGVFMVEGLVQGIEKGEDDVSSVVSNLIEKAVDSAKGTINDATKAFRAGGSSLFEAFFGSGNAAGGTRIGDLSGSVTEAFNSLGSTLDSSFEQAADVLKRSATEALSHADLDILGELGNSLSAADVLGAANRSALVASLDAISAVGKEMIDQGAPAQQVTATLAAYTDRLRALAAQYGLNADQVNALIDQTGLSSDTLGQFVNTMATLESGLGHVTSKAKTLNDTIVDLFQQGTTGDKFKTQLGVGAAEAARGAVTTAFQSVRSALDSSLGAIKSAQEEAGKGPLSLAQQAIIGSDALSLDFNDILGVANRSAITSAVSAIQKMGEALLEGGSSADYVTSQINEQVGALLGLTDALGFNHDQVVALISGLGLSGDALAAFLAQVQAATDASNQAAAAQASATDAAQIPGLPPGSNAFTPAAPDVEILPRDITVNLSVPYGDPQAIALAVGNKVATSIRLIGG